MEINKFSVVENFKSARTAPSEVAFVKHRECLDSLSAKCRQSSTVQISSSNLSGRLVDISITMKSRTTSNTGMSRRRVSHE
jgi:hypothetical protein